MANFGWERLVIWRWGRWRPWRRFWSAWCRSPAAGSRRRHAVAEIAVELEATRCLTYHALRLFAAGQNAVREVTEAKLLSQRAAFRVAESASCLLDRDEEIARVLRDTRLGPIGGGTDEVMKEILGKQLGL